MLMLWKWLCIGRVMILVELSRFVRGGIMCLFCFVLLVGLCFVFWVC